MCCYRCWRILASFLYGLNISHKRALKMQDRKMTDHAGPGKWRTYVDWNLRYRKMHVLCCVCGHVNWHGKQLPNYSNMVRHFQVRHSL